MYLYMCGLVLFWCWALLGVIVVFFSLMLSPALISGNMPVNPLLALFQNFEQVSNFVQHHISNFIGPHLQSSGLPGSGFLLSVSSSTKAPLAKTTSSVQLGDTAVKVSISWMLIFIATILPVSVVLLLALCGFLNWICCSLYVLVEFEYFLLYFLKMFFFL